MTDFAARRMVMVDTQIRPSDVTKFPIIDAMLTIAREDFVPVSQREAAYVGENIMLEGSRVVLEPRTLAKMLDALNLSNDELVLDVGTAYGYSSAVISRMAEAVVAVEQDDTMFSEAQEAFSNAGIDNVVMHHAELAEGADQHGPYDVIIVQGGVETFPDKLAAQLKDGGRAACLFVSGALGEVRIGHKRGDRMSWRMAFNAGAPVLDGFRNTVEFEL